MNRNDKKCDFTKCGSNVCGWCQQEQRPEGCMKAQAEETRRFSINRKGTLIVTPKPQEGWVSLADAFQKVGLTRK